MLDTNVAIHLRDGDAVVDERVDALSPPLLLSIVSRVELEADLGPCLLYTSPSPRD